MKLSGIAIGLRDRFPGAVFPYLQQVNDIVCLPAVCRVDVAAGQDQYVAVGKVIAVGYQRRTCSPEGGGHRCRGRPRIGGRS